MRGCDEHFSPFFSLLMNERNKLPLYHLINVLIYALLVKLSVSFFITRTDMGPKKKDGKAGKAAPGEEVEGEDPMQLLQNYQKFCK